MIKAAINKGYSLSPNTDVLSAYAISKYLNEEYQNLRIEVFKTLTSTNEAVRKLAINGEAEGKVIISEEQTAGRGRGNRSFFSPAGTGIYMSILLRPKLIAADSALLTTAAAAAVAAAIERISGKNTQIKWINDIYVQGRKVCGILTEASMSLKGGGLDYAVLGIGINVSPPSGGFPEELAGIAAAIFSKGDNMGDIRNRLTAEVLNSFMAYYSHLADKPFLPEYKKRIFILGKTVTVLKGEGQREATALDIDSACRLKVRYGDGAEEYLSSGEIRIKT